jgi:calpain-7
VRLQLATSTTSSIPLNLAIFERGTGNKLGRQIITTGPYSDARSGVVTPPIKLQKGTYILLPSTYKPGVEASFRILVYSSRAVKVAERA